MLAQESCCTRSRVGGRSCQRQRVQVRFSVAVLTLVVVAHQFSAEVGLPFRMRRLAVVFNAVAAQVETCCPNWETRVCEIHFFFLRR